MEYQRAVKNWLEFRSFLGFKTEPFGDAYDQTKKAAEIGSSFFDFSLKLKKADQVKQILYAECKFRREKHGNTNREFNEFIKKVYFSLSGPEENEAENAEFCFISNIPPDKWRKFLNDKFIYSFHQLKKENIEIKPRVINSLANQLHILILSEAIIRR